MSRTSQVLFAVISIVLSVGLAAVGAIPLAPPLVFGCSFIVLTIVLLAWHRLALSRYHGSDVVIFSRGPWSLILSLIVIEVLCALDVLLAPTGDNRIWLFLGYFLVGIAYLAFLPGTLAFWVADNIGLTSQILAFKRRLLWGDIDWIYLQSNTTTRKQYMIPVARWKDEQLIVEAGSRRRMDVLVRTPLAGGAPSPILQAISARATHAAFGIDQLPAVQARRRSQASVLSPQTNPNISLHDAVELARGPSIPASWARFPVRRGAIWPNILLYTALALFMIGFGAFIVASGTVVGLDQIPQSWLEGPGRSLILLGEGILCAGCGLWLFFGVSLRWLRTLRHPQDYFFLVTPRYVVEVKGQKTDGIELADVRNVSRSGGGVYGWTIVFEMRNGKKTEYDVGAIYGSSRDLYAYILAALNGQRPSRPVTPYGQAIHSEGDM